MTTHPAAARRVKAFLAGRARFRVLLLFVLLVVTVVALRGIDQGEFNLNVDETIHAVTGLYFADFLRDLPLTHPIQYTYEYYAQYPALGLIHWPPFFYFVEGLAFLLLGPSAVVARLTVLLFALVGLSFWFKLITELHDELTAAASTLFLAFLPTVLLYTKAAMLEVPSLALCIGSIYFWIKYLREETARYLYGFVIFTALALLTKQNAIFILPFCLLTFLATRKWHLLKNWALYRAVALGFVLVAPFYFLTLLVHRQTVIDHVVMANDQFRASLFQRLIQDNRLTFYWQALPDQLGWPLLALSILGILTCWRWGKRDTNLLMLAWIVACYVTFTFLGARAPRYVIYWLPPFVYFAAAPLTINFSSSRVRVLSRVILLVLILMQARIAWAYERPYVVGYAAMAKHLVEHARHGDPTLLLFDGALPGNLIFYLRAYDPARRFVVLRKMLYTTRLMKAIEYRELVQTESDIQELIDRYGIKYVLITENTRLDFKAQKILRDLLQTPQFRQTQRIQIESSRPTWQGVELVLYENQRAQSRSAEQLRIEMLTLDRDIVVSLD